MMPDRQKRITKTSRLVSPQIGRDMVCSHLHLSWWPWGDPATGLGLGLMKHPARVTCNAKGEQVFYKVRRCPC